MQRQDQVIERQSREGTFEMLDDRSSRSDLRRIVHLTSVHPPFDIRIFVKQCRTLARAGYAVTLITPHDRDEAVNGVQIVAIAKVSRRAQRILTTTWQIARKALELDADLYHFHDPELISVGLLLRAHGKQVIYDVHEDVPSDILVKSYLPNHLRKPIAWLAGKFQDLTSRYFSAIVAATPTIGARFREINPQTIVINNYALRDELISAAPATWSQRRPIVTYVGSGISMIRGIAQMVEAMEYVPEHLGATLELAGTFGSPVQREQVMKLHGWAHVVERGLLDRVEVACLLGRAQAGLLLLHPTSSYVWSQPIKLYEYMSAGIPVIASDFPLWREQIEPIGCALLVDPLDPHAIARAIEYVLTHPSEAEAMGRRGREAVEKFYNWEAEETKLLKLYRDLLD